MTTTPADWYPDPERLGQLRYWDGSQWTEHRAPAPPMAVPTPATPGSGAIACKHCGQRGSVEAKRFMTEPLLSRKRKMHCRSCGMKWTSF